MKKLIPTLVFLIMLTACTDNSNTKTPTPTVIAPTITEFTSSSGSIIANEEDVTFNWTIEGTDPITVTITSLGNLSDTIKTFTPEETTATFSPLEYTTYTLSAENSAGKVSQDIGITVWHRCFSDCGL